MAKKIKLDSDIYLLKQLIVVANEAIDILDKIYTDGCDESHQIINMSDDAMKKVETIKNGMSDIIEDLDDKNKRE